MAEKKVGKILIFIMTLGILVTLLISAPALAYVLRLDVSSTKVSKGDVVSFTASVQIEPEDRASITSLQLRLIGPLDIICKFRPDGTIIDGCNGINITKISKCSNYVSYEGYNGYDSPGYGNTCLYGYYGEDETLLTYNITYDTGSNFAGTYKTSLVVLAGNNPLNTMAGSDIIVNATINPGKYCSIRAKKGSATLEGSSFGTNNKINFYVPAKNPTGSGARPGKGYIMGQKDRTTFSFDFTINDVLERNENQTVVSVTGKYKIGLNKQSDEKAVLVLNKKSNTLNVLGSDLKIAYMNVNFQQGGC